MSEIDERVQTAKVVAANVLEFLGGLSLEQISLPSACDAWQVRDVASHLIGGAERQLESMRRGRAGESGPPEGFQPVNSETASSTNAGRDIQRREQLGDGLVAAFDAAYAGLAEELDGFAASGSWDTLCWHMRRGAMPASDYVDLRIQELVIHDWDMRTAVEDGPSLDQRGIPALMDASPKWLGMSFRPGPKLDAPVTFRFDTGGKSLTVTVEGDGFEFQEAAVVSRAALPGVGGAARADLVVSCDPSDYLLYIYGRLTGRQGLDSGKLTGQGDTSLLPRFEAWFKGV